MAQIDPWQEGEGAVLCGGVRLLEFPIRRGWAGCRRWLGAVSGVGCQIWVAGIVHFLSVTRIKSLRTSNISGF